MNGSGTLRLVTRAEQDGITVEVADTGPGMTPQVAARAFDAFYTTKDTGQGTGLGLDIARRRSRQAALSRPAAQRSHSCGPRKATTASRFLEEAPIQPPAGLAMSAPG